MEKKKVLNALLWSALMVVVQVVVDVVRHTAINWIEVLIGAAIVFLICIGSKKNPTIERKNPEKAVKGPNNNMNTNAAKNDDAAKKADSNMNANMGDLRFYTYNRIALIGVAAGAGCLLYARMAHEGTVFWLYVVSAACFIQAIVFFILYAKKREEFVQKESESRAKKK